ncbi:MAG: biopolymer transporter ExbD [Ideonella sp.]|jgi:biopolymer transport protein ExbD|nr:biopolymer transporter ExbD [Ideonella sp.]
MGMNVGSPLGGSGDPEPMVEINTTPLIDVMLVLLIMLIITIPIQLHAVNLNMPVGTPPPQDVPPQIVKIDIDENSVVFWQGVAVADAAELDAKMREVAALPSQPEIHLRPNKDAQYAVVANVLAATKRVGLNKIGVVGAEQFLDR